MTFKTIREQDRMEQIGFKLEQAMNDINAIVQHPESIINAKYDCGDNENKTSFITLTIDYEDTNGDIKKARKQILESVEQQLLRELDEIKKEKAKYG